MRQHRGLTSNDFFHFHSASMARCIAESRYEEVARKRPGYNTKQLLLFVSISSVTGLDRIYIDAGLTSLPLHFCKIYLGSSRSPTPECRLGPPSVPHLG